MSDDEHDAAGAIGDRASSTLAAVTREMVSLYRDLFGRGPANARSHWAGDDVLVCLLHGSLTPAERNMVKMGEHQRLRDVRLYFQYATESSFREAVERATGRGVHAFTSAIDTEKDIAVETFVLEPRTT